MMLNGIPTAQLEEQINMFHRLIKKYEVKTFIELGTFMGGLTYEMILKYPEMKIYSFGNDRSELNILVRNRPEIHIRDIFQQDTINFISDIIRTSEGTILLFCDNGNKIKEFDLFYPFLRSGDLVQVHDYPDEATPEFVERVNKNCLDLEPIDQEYYLENNTVCWRKLAS